MLEYTKDELKKVFYKQKTTAHFMAVKKSGIYYQATVPLTEDSYDVNSYQDILFIIPLDPKEIGDARFEESMPAKHLIRWMQ
jgi:hypothetical protein